MNPFNPQDPARPEYFYGRNSIIERYKSNLRQYYPMNLMIVGEWGIGKTSTLKKIRSIEIEGQSVGRVMMTVTNEEEENFESFAFSLIKELRSEFDDFGFDWKIDDIHLNVLTLSRDEMEEKPKDVFLDKMRDVWEKAQQKHDKIVIFLDDFDLMYGQQMSIRNCFQKLREEGCRYMLVGTCTPEILEYSDLDEPFNRFFDHRDLDTFTLKDTKGMVRFVLDRSKLNVKITDELLEKLHEETNGHPHYLTLFMHEIIRNKKSDTLSLEDYEMSESEIMTGVSAHLERKFSDLTEKEMNAINSAIDSRKDIFRPSDLEDVSNPSEVCGRLCDKEVFDRVSHGRYDFRHPLTRKYFEQIIPG